MAKFTKYKGKGKQPFRFRFEAEGHTLASEGYTATAGRDNGVRSVQENSLLPTQYDRRVSDDGKPYFVIKGGNGEIIAKSRPYGDEAEREVGVFKVVSTAHFARVVDGEPEKPKVVDKPKGKEKAKEPEKAKGDKK